MPSRTLKLTRRAVIYSRWRDPKPFAAASPATRRKSRARRPFQNERSEQRDDEQRHDVNDLDERVHRGAGGVLVGIAHRVAGHRRLVGIAALAAEVAVLDVILG